MINKTRMNTTLSNRITKISDLHLHGYITKALLHIVQLYVLSLKVIGLDVKTNNTPYFLINSHFCSVRHAFMSKIKVQVS